MYPETTFHSVLYNNRPQGTNRTRSGADLTVRYITNQAKHCPNQRFAIGGYGLGARVIHKMKLPKDLKAKVVAIVVFGDLYHRIRLRITRVRWPIESPEVNREPLHHVGFENSQNVASFCIIGDPVCLRGTNVVTHVQYGQKVM
ncbi:cutinase [Rhizoctonia solani 123E]|uniref:Cutinase n=1 Tax=Rhizoctonia solani 123E TaxID=1423351 RepID=A0A074SGW2_9AGAM|nr:cutinase [Rhizoctonia solani 123E]